MSTAANRSGRTSGTNAVSQAMLETAHSLSVDLVTREVVSALRDKGVPSILLKGPTIANWLYRDGQPRPYGDCDLLVPPHLETRAQEVLLALGFRYGYESLAPGALEPGLFWTRGSATVDLHTTLQGIECDPRDVWPTLAATAETATVGGIEVSILETTARAMHVALHAAQHGRREAATMRDLGRALALLPFETWTQAADLATRLDASPAFATGLSLLPEGEAVVTRLGLEKDRSVTGLLCADTAPTVAFTLEELRATRGPAARARLLARKTFPTRAHMRLYWPLARRGYLGLALAYLWRMADKLGKLIPALIAWRRARRESR